MTHPADAGDVLEGVRAILRDELLLKDSDVRPESLLVQDLNLDSLGFIEFSFGIEERFGVEFPDLKTNAEVLALTMPEGLNRIEAAPGGATLFEFVKIRAVQRLLEGDATVSELAARLDVPVPAGLDGAARAATLSASDVRTLLAPLATASPEGSHDTEADGVSVLTAGEARERLFRTETVSSLAHAVGGPVPAGLEPETPLSQLVLADLFRFLTVDVMARYVSYLRTMRRTPAEP